MAQTLEERFWAKVDIRDLNECWIWTGATTGGKYCSYGRIRLTGERKMVSAHRLSYEWHIGRIPEELEIDHLCKNPKCVNPTHLEAVTHAENVKRRKVASQCLRGHEYTLENTYSYTRGDGRMARACRTCQREKMRRYRRLQNHPTKRNN